MATVLTTDNLVNVDELSESTLSLTDGIPCLDKDGNIKKVLPSQFDVLLCEKKYATNNKLETTNSNVATLNNNITKTNNKVTNLESNLSENYATKTELETTVNNVIAEIVANSPEDFDTLKEIADWIDTHEDSASAMNSAIQTNKNNLTNEITDRKSADTTLQANIDKKVDKVSGKGLSTNDYTTAEKTKLSGIAEGANKTTVDSALSSTSTNPVQNKVVNTALGNKVDKVSGKGLSTNDYTTAEKTKLSGIAEGANKTTVDSALSSTSTNPVQNKVLYSKISTLESKISTLESKISTLENSLSVLNSKIGTSSLKILGF